MLRFLGVVFLGLIAFAMLNPGSKGGREALGGNAPRLAMSLRGGPPAVMRYVDEVPWSGPGMRTATMQVYCTDGAFIIGEVAGYYLALNGHTSQWSEQIKVTPASGTERRVFSPDRYYLQQLGLIEAGADPLEFNRPAAAGRQLGREACRR